MNTIIFDFDGTIADSFDIVISIAYKLTKKQEISNIAQVEQYRNNNLGLMDALKTLNIPKWKLPYLLLMGRSMMAQQIENVPMFAGIDSLLSDLVNNKFSLYIISSNSTKNIEKFLLQKGLIGYFIRAYGGAGLFNKSKLIAKLIKKESIDRQNCVYVGDEVRDVQAAKKLNIPCIAVSWGYNSDHLLMKANPMVVARNTEQLKQIIIEWSKTI